MNIKPQEDELRGRLRRQLARAKNVDNVVLVWSGYLSGIFEWGLISADTHKRLLDELPEIGRQELFDLFMDGSDPND